MRVTHPSWLIIYIHTYTRWWWWDGWNSRSAYLGGHPTWKIGRYVPSTWHRDDDLQIKISGQTVCPRFLFSRDDRWRLHFESDIASHFLDGNEWGKEHDRIEWDRNPFREVFEKKSFFFFKFFGQIRKENLF